MLIHQMIKWGLNKHENWYKKNVMAGQSRFGEPVTHFFCYTCVAKSHFP